MPKTASTPHLILFNFSFGNYFIWQPIHFSTLKFPNEISQNYLHTYVHVSKGPRVYSRSSYVKVLFLMEIAIGGYTNLAKDCGGIQNGLEILLQARTIQIFLVCFPLVLFIMFSAKLNKNFLLENICHFITSKSRKSNQIFPENVCLMYYIFALCNIGESIQSCFRIMIIFPYLIFDEIVPQLHY